MPKLLAVDRVTAGYGDSIILEDVSLDLDEAGSLALLGRNGVGKTTLLLTLMGMTRVKSGTSRSSPAYRATCSAACAKAFSIWGRFAPAGRYLSSSRSSYKCP